MDDWGAGFLLITKFLMFYSTRYPTNPNVSQHQALVSRRL